MQQASPSAVYYVFDCCSLIAKLVYGLKRVTRIWILDGNKMVLFLLNGENDGKGGDIMEIREEKGGGYRCGKLLGV